MQPLVFALGLVLLFLGCATPDTADVATECFDVQDGSAIVGAVTWAADAPGTDDGIYHVRDDDGVLLGRVAYRGTLYQVEPASRSELFRGCHDMDGALELLFGRPVRLVLALAGE